MIRSHISKMTGGWFIGDFDPAILRTRDFEVCYKRHPKGEVWPRHFHKRSTEYNVLLKGSMRILIESYDGSETSLEHIEPGEIFVVSPGEVAEPEFLEDCELIIVKTPSQTDDKFAIPRWMTAKQALELPPLVLSDQS